MNMTPVSSQQKAYDKLVSCSSACLLTSLTEAPS
jgi:hypothetical protein